MTTKSNFVEISVPMRLFFNALVFALLVVVPYTIVCAQSGKDEKANQILKSVSSKYNNLKSLEVAFKVTIKDQKDNSSNSQSGTLAVQDQKYALELKGQKVICDGQTVWTYLEEVNEVQINPVEENELSITPKNIFTIYENGFSSRFRGELDAGATTIQQVELVPDDENRSFFKVLLNIDKKQKRLTGAKIFEKSGTIIFYTIESFKENVVFDDNKFTFVEADHPGVEVIDLR
jgi:outer membrane lipoprotein-sorting protein